LIEDNVMTLDELWRRNLQHGSIDDPVLDKLDEAEMDRFLERVEKSLMLHKREDDTIP